MRPSVRPPRLPGHLLHALARCVAGNATLSNVIEPTLADLQHEVTAARGSSAAARIRARWRGYAAFWKVVALEFPFWRLAMDMRLALRMFRIAGLATLAYAFVLGLLPALAFLPLSALPPSRAPWLRYQLIGAIQSTLPYALFAVALTFAPQDGLSSSSRRARWIALVTGIAALGSLALSVWLVPHAPLDLHRPTVGHSEAERASSLLSVQAPLVYPVACAVLSMLGFGLAPRLRRRLARLLAIAFVPIALAAFRKVIFPLVALGDPVAGSIAIPWLPYALVGCLAGCLLLAPRSRSVEA